MLDNFPSEGAGNVVSTDAKYSLPRSTGERTTKSAGSVIEPERSHPGKPGGDPV